MPKRILIDGVYPEDTRVVIHDNNRVLDFDYETLVKEQLKGNIYLAKVTRVEPSLQAAFVEYGGNRHGFLPFAEIHPDYYQIPVADRAPSDEEGAEATAELTPSDDTPIGIEHAMRHIEALPMTDDDAEEDIPPVITTTSEPEAGPDDGVVAAEATSLTPTVDIGDGDAVEDAEDEVIHVSTINEDAIEDDEDDSDEPKRSELYRQYKIQEVLKRGQVILVQVMKEERGNKGASLTSYISLAGRYCVLMPNTERQGGVSRKIASFDDRRRLKSILDSLEMPKGTSVIIRTAGMGKTKPEIRRDYDYLVRLWNHIREVTLSSTAPAFIHAEGTLIKRVIRDLYDNTIDEILIEGEEAYQTGKKIMKMMVPSHAGRVKQYKGDAPLFARYKVEEQLASLYDNVATLESGGYLVINPTEALISIDVNSGRATSERNIEETALKTNLEAAREVARQLKLRDLSGLVVIDFIDMMDARNRRMVERTLRDALQFDRAKIQIGRISPFGLLEMSRQRLRPSFLEANAIACSHCEGRGLVRAPETTAVAILRALENDARRGDVDALEVFAAAPIVLFMLNQKRAEISSIEKRCDVSIHILIDSEAGADTFNIEKRKRKAEAGKSAAATAGAELEYAPSEDFAEEESTDEEGRGRRRNWRKRRGGRNSEGEGQDGDNASSGQNDDAPPPAYVNTVSIIEDDRADEALTQGAGRSRGRRRSGGGGQQNNGGNNRRRRGGNGQRNSANNNGGDGEASFEGNSQPSRRNRGGNNRRRSPQQLEAATAAPAGDGSSLLKGLWKRITQ